MNALQNEKNTFQTQLLAKPKERIVNAPVDNTELFELRRLNNNLTNELALRDNELNKHKSHHNELENTIRNLRNEITQTKTMINIKEDNTDYDSIINNYKNKINTLNTQLQQQ